MRVSVFILLFNRDIRKSVMVSVKVIVKYYDKEYMVKPYWKIRNFR